MDENKEEVKEETKEEVKETKAEETKTEETKKKNKKKATQEVFHCTYALGEVPQKRSDIDLQYIIDYCEAKNQTEWFVKSYEKYNPDGNTKGYAFKIKDDFISKFFGKEPWAKGSSTKATNVGQEAYKKFKTGLIKK